MRRTRSVLAQGELCESTAGEKRKKKAARMVCWTRTMRQLRAATGISRRENCKAILSPVAPCGAQRVATPPVQQEKQKAKGTYYVPFAFLAPPAGLEPATP